MALKFKCQTKEEVPAEHLPLYAERDGGWQLDVDGVADKGRLEEFRANNIALKKERDELMKRFEGIDPEEVRKLAEEKKRLTGIAMHSATEAALSIAGKSARRNQSLITSAATGLPPHSARWRFRPGRTRLAAWRRTTWTQASRTSGRRTRRSGAAKGRALS